MRLTKGVRGFTLVETMLLSVLLIIASLGVGGLLFKQKQSQVGTQQAIVGRKILTESISKLQAATWQYPFFVLKSSGLSPSDAGIVGMLSSVALSYVSCYDRMGNPVAASTGTLKPVPFAVDNRTLTADRNCLSSGGMVGTGVTLGGAGIGAGSIHTGATSSVCNAAMINSAFTLSGLCTAATSAEFEVQVTPMTTATTASWDGSYDVWVISLLTDEQKQQKGVLRHYFREQVVIEQ
jgi:hypothetical protein